MDSQTLSPVSQDTALRPERNRTRILALSCTFPNHLQPQLGTFVRARLHRLADLAAVKVIAPLAVMEYGNAARRGFPAVRSPRLDGEDENFEVLRPRWFYPPFGGCLNSIFLFAQLLIPIARLRKRFRFEMIDAHFGFPDGIAAALLAMVFRCPFVITLRGNETLHADYFFRGVAICWAIRRAARVITVSERLRQFAISCGADPGRAITIPNGVDTGVFHPSARERARARLDLAKDAPVILSAGYLIERKGHHRIVRALRVLRDSGIPAHLVIAGGPGGEGAFEPVLRKLAADLNLENEVHFLGHVSPSAMAEWMSAADVLCLASTREGWPNVVNEALACGAPVVATDIGGVPDMLPSEEYGIIVPVGDQDSLTHALGRALRKRWDRRAIAQWGMRRSWQAVASEVLEVLRTVVEPRI